ncbi:MAG: hypothetical protein ABR585_11250 [Gemmatimonadaceae bacterium]
MAALFAIQQAAFVPTGVVGAVNRFADFLLQYAGALAAVGALSMALIEFAKKVLDSRTKFQTLRWTTWTTRSDFAAAIPSDIASLATKNTSESLTTKIALAELLQLCTGISKQEARTAAQQLIDDGGHLPLRHAWYPDPAHAVFALDLGRMMGSIQEAADVALAAPTQYSSLYLFMTSGAEPSDVSEWYKTGPTAIVVDNQAGNEAEQRLRVKEHAERFARLRQIVKRKLDGFQLYTGDRWASWNQFAANGVGFVVMLCTLVSLQWPTPAPIGVGATISAFFSSISISIILLSLLGGILSPVAKDLVTALKRVKDG